MRIIKMKGSTEEIVLKEIEREYGEKAIVISTQKEEINGPLKWFKKPNTVVTVAIKEEGDTKDKTDETLAIVPQKEETDSYELLMDLKNQMGELHKELGALKSNPPQTIVKQTILQKENLESEVKENKVTTYIRDKLLNLGVRLEVCEFLLAQTEAEDSEDYIRKLYNALEEVLIQKEAKELSQIIFFIGSTGVGKTTTIAKLTAQYVLEEQKKVVLFTSDTYRIAAVEQLKTYADILGVPIEIIYDENDLPKYIEKWKDMDYILIDTAGRSHKNEEQVTELSALMKKIKEKQIFLTLNANTNAKDVRKIVETYEKVDDTFDLIITKLDETDEMGNVVNINYYAQKPIMYLTNGQNVPADIKPFNKLDYITELLRRLNDE